MNIIQGYWICGSEAIRIEGIDGGWFRTSLILLGVRGLGEIKFIIKIAAVVLVSE